MDHARRSEVGFRPPNPFPERSYSVVVSTRGSDPRNPGSNPGRTFIFPQRTGGASRHLWGCPNRFVADRVAKMICPHAPPVGHTSILPAEHIILRGPERHASSPHHRPSPSSALAPMPPQIHTRPQLHSWTESLAPTADRPPSTASRWAMSAIVKMRIRNRAYPANAASHGPCHHRQPIAWPGWGPWVPSGHAQRQPFCPGPLPQDLLVTLRGNHCCCSGQLLAQGIGQGLSLGPLPCTLCFVVQSRVLPSALPCAHPKVRQPKIYSYWQVVWLYGTELVVWQAIFAGLRAHCTR